MPSFSDIVGQDKALSFIRKTLAGGRLPPAFLFQGMEGIGKKKTALALAGAVNCAVSGSEDACGTCPSCLKVERGTHPDVRVLAPEGEYITVEQVRQLVSDLSYAAFEGKTKVAILDGAEALHWSAANALLKTLEEPPPHTLLVLLVTRPEALPQTIPSRCQRVKFSPLDTGSIAGLLREHHGIREGKALLMAALSEGSLGRALTMDEEVLERRDRICDAVLFHRQTGLAEMFTLARECSHDVGGFLAAVEGLLADLLCARIGAEEMIRNTDRLRDVHTASGGYDMEDIVTTYETVDRVRAALRRNVNQELALDVVLLDAVRRRRQ